MIDELLSPRRIESLVPESGAAEAAWDEVCRRRRTRNLRAQVLAGVGVVVAVMVGLLPSLDDGGRVAELDVAGRETTEARTVETPSLSDADPENPSDAPSGDAGKRGTGSGRAPGAAVAAPPADVPRPGAQAPTPGRPKPAMGRTRYENIYIGCLEWCMSAQALKNGSQYDLMLDLCVAPGSRARRFSYATTLETDLWVTATGAQPETYWTWSSGQTFPPNEHHVDLRAGECITWTVLWDATDESGSPLPPGNYQLFAKSLADQVAPDRTTTQTTFQITE